MMKKLIVCASIFGTFAASANTIVVTPGSVAGYSYFPPSTQKGSGGGGSGEDVSTLQRCLWAPNKGDQYANVIDDFGYEKEVKVLYKIVGGDGGPGINGGGGGSSAIIKNGGAVVIAEGGNGGKSAVVKSGVFVINKGDALRFVTGGGGGTGVWGGNFSIGGGGGAGYMGGGGGASHKGTNLGASSDMGGRGGGAAGGAGGYAPGTWAGTAGAYLTGGISTYLNGSTAPIGSPNGNAYQWHNYRNFNTGDTYVSQVSKYPATATRQGSPMGDWQGKSWVSEPAWLAGGGGKLGVGGSGAVDAGTKVGNYSADTSGGYYRGNECTYCSSYFFAGSDMLNYPPHTTDMALTRRILVSQNGGPTDTQTWPNGGSSLGGQIILMYQAPVCGMIN